MEEVKTNTMEETKVKEAETISKRDMENYVKSMKIQRKKQLDMMEEERKELTLLKDVLQLREWHNGLTYNSVVVARAFLFTYVAEEEDKELHEKVISYIDKILSKIKPDRDE